MAAAGAVAVGGKVALDKLAGRQKGHRKYRLNLEEPIPDGIRRVARGQLDGASEELGRASDRKIGDAVHEARKSLKRLRALVRSCRAAIGDDTYRFENAEFREAGRVLSGARDSKVLIETLDGLRGRFGDELAPEKTDPLRFRLEGEHARALEGVSHDGVAVASVLAKLDAAGDRTARWAFQVEGFESIMPGIDRIYRRGRKRMRAAASEPSTENLHEWRKRVKDLWHACQIVQPAAPGRLKKLGKQAHHLSDLLGEEHDLAVLRGYVAAHPSSIPDAGARQTLHALIDRRRQALQEEALDLGARVFKQKPKRFVQSLERGWEKRVAEQPVA